MEKILVVEDDPAHLMGLEDNLKFAGYEVSTARSGREALTVLKQEKFDLVILDIMLPYIDGFEVCKRFREWDDETPIIMLTAKTQERDRVQGLDIGADDYITKPFDLEELKLRVKNAMARAQYESLTNPTTGLPSGRLIEDQLRQLMRRDDWGIIYVGIRGFSTFGEVYGFVAGEEVLRFAAMVLGQAVDNKGGTTDDFIGHVGGDDFIVITNNDLIAPIVKDLKHRFDTGVGTHYDWQTRQQGYLILRDGAGNEVKSELMKLSIGVLAADDGPFADIREITEAAASARREGQMD